LGLNHSSLKSEEKYLKKKKKFKKLSSRKAEHLGLGCYVCTVILNYIPNYLVFEEHEMKVATINLINKKCQNSGSRFIANLPPFA